MPSTRNDSPSKINISRQCSITYKPGKIERSCHLFGRQIQDKFTWSVNIEHVNTEHFKTKTTYPTYQLRSQKNGTIVMVRHKPCKPYTDHLCIIHVLSLISHNLVWIHLSQMPLADESQELNHIHQKNDYTTYPKNNKSWPELNQYNNSQSLSQLTSFETTNKWRIRQTLILEQKLKHITPQCKNQW